MSYGPFHRIGEPGGQGCAVSALSISMKDSEGNLVPAVLLDAGTEATEVELLRTILEKFGVRWGHDELGWWAVVPNQTT